MSDDPVEQLSAILREVGARPTIDVQRTTRRPCYLCGTEDSPRALVEIGVYTRRMGGNLQPGDKIERPLCKRCEELTR